MKNLQKKEAELTASPRMRRTEPTQPAYVQVGILPLRFFRPHENGLHNRQQPRANSSAQRTRIPF